MVHILFINILHGFQRLFQSSGAVCDLSVRKHLARLNGIAVTDLPGSDAHLLCQYVDQGFQCELTLAYAEATERASRRVIGVITVTTDIGVLIAVRSYRVGTCTLQNRSAKRCVSTGIEVDLTVQTGKDTVLITAQGKGSFHRMTLRMEV